MKSLTFGCRSFAWQSFSKTLDEVEEQEVRESVEDALVVFLHVEASDATDDGRTFRKTLKHIKWLANKQGLRTIVLHSFTHLGGENAEPAYARDLMERLAARLEGTGYTVAMTPFGYFCAWQIDVLGGSLAKVYKSW